MKLKEAEMTVDSMYVEKLRYIFVIATLLGRSALTLFWKSIDV